MPFFNAVYHETFVFFQQNNLLDEKTKKKRWRKCQCVFWVSFQIVFRKWFPFTFFFLLRLFQVSVYFYGKTLAWHVIQAWIIYGHFQTPFASFRPLLKQNCPFLSMSSFLFEFSLLLEFWKMKQFGLFFIIVLPLKKHPNLLKHCFFLHQIKNISKKLLQKIGFVKTNIFWKCTQTQKRAKNVGRSTLLWWTHT